MRLNPRVGDASHGKLSAKNPRQSRLGLPKESAQPALPTKHLQEQLDAYDDRLSDLRDQLRHSVDQILTRSSIQLEKDETYVDANPAIKETIVQGLVIASGQGCKEVLQGSVAAKKGSKSGHVWKSRSPKGTQLKSSCTLKLVTTKSCNVTIKITFADGDSVPGVLLFEHAPKATAAFKPLGKVSLQKKSLKQLKHVFHLGNDVIVDRYLRVSCMGQIGDSKNNFHAVSYLFISGHAADPNCDSSEDEEQVVTDDAVEVHVSMDNISPAKPMYTVAHAKPRKRTSPNVWERLSGQVPASERKEKVVKEAPAPQKVLDTDRIRLVEDTLRGLRMSSGSDAAEMVKNIVFGKDSNILNMFTQEQVDELIACLPTKDERKLLRLLDPAKVGNEAEEFMHEIIGIDNLSAKIETKWFLADFDARAAVVQDAANLISRACNEIHQCQKLHLAIKLILSECSESLERAKILDVTLLKELKNTHYSSKGSLLHFVAAKMSEASGSMKVPNIAKDLPSCSPASEVTLSDIKCELKQLTDGIEEASTAWRADEPAAGFIEKRISAALTKLSSTEAIVTEAEADFLESAIDAGLDPSSADESSDLFLAILAFSDELNNAHLENKCVGFLTKSKEAHDQNTNHYVSQGSELQEEPSDFALPCVSEHAAEHHVSEKEEAHTQVVTAHTPISSRVSVDQLLQSVKKPLTIAPQEHSPVSNKASVDTDGSSSDPDDLSTPVRKLLQSSRAILDSFDMKTLESSPYKYENKQDTMPKVEELDADGLCEISSPPAHVMQTSEAGFGSESEVVPHVSKVEQGEKGTENMKTNTDETIKSVDSAEETMKNAIIVEQVKSSIDKSDIKSAREGRGPAESGSSQKNLSESIDLQLAAKLLKNAEQVKMSRSQQSLQKSTRRRSPLVRSGEKRLPSATRSRTSRLSLERKVHSQSLTPEQAKAVKALGEVIRQSLPKFSSAEADKQSGLHLDAQNLDLDKILSTLILNAGNTPTGPLARGVRGGNVSLFDGEEANELRRSEQERHCGMQHGRKALLEPVVPAPLGMGVTVSKTVSEGISPETIARSLHSGMRTGSVRASSSKSGKGSVHQKAPERHEEAPKAIEHGSLHDSAPWKKSQENSNQTKVSQQQPQPPSAPVWSAAPQTINTGMYEQRYPPPVPKEHIIDTPPHGIEFGEDRSDLDGLSPMGLRCTREDALKSSRDNAAMAADRMQLWGYNM